MPTPGEPTYALDFTDAVSDDELADETAFTSTSYTAGAAVVGQSFVAPTSGRVLVLWRARFQNNSPNQRAVVSVEVRTGSTVFSGTVVSPADDDSALECPNDTVGGGDTRLQAGTWRLVTGLTAGAAYNATIVHKTFGGNATIFSRSLAVVPVP